MFNAKEAKKQCLQWMKQWYSENGSGCNIIIGISGGLDSSVVAALCVEAFGRDKVIGVLMPNGAQKDIDMAYALVEYLGIAAMEININDAYYGLMNELRFVLDKDISEQTKINLPARLRMATLYAIAQSKNGRVANTCNLSEDYIGYSTRYGDSAGDFAPLAGFTKGEVKAIALALGLPTELVEKIPSDGLCGKTDEENFGFSYAVLDRYIRTGECDNPKDKEKIDYLHEKNKFKMMLMPGFYYEEDKYDK